MIETVTTIIWAASLGILLVTAIVGLIGGLRRGAYHAGVKLGAHVVSVFLALMITLLLRGVVVSAVSNALVDRFSQLAEYADLIELIAHVPTSVLLLGVFWVIFIIVRAVMRISQKRLCEKLPANYREALENYEKRLQLKQEIHDAFTPPTHPMPSEALGEADELTDSPKPDAVASDGAAILQGDESADVAVQPPITEEKRSETDTNPMEEVEHQPVSAAESFRGIHPMAGKLLWYGSAALCGVLSSVLMLGVMIMPISSTTVRVGKAMIEITDTLESDAVLSEKLHTDFGKIGEGVRKTTQSPLFTVTDFFYGKTVYEPLTSYTTAYGRINLSKELNTGTQMICKLIPVVSQMLGSEELREQDAQVLSDVTKQVTESDFFLAVGTFWMQHSATQMGEGNDGEAKTPARQELEKDLAHVMSQMTPELLAKDLETVADFFSAIADSSLLKVLADDTKDPTIANLSDREMMREVFGILYDNDHSRYIFVSVVNVGSEAVFKELKTDPVYSNADLDAVSREAMLEEADRLCQAMVGLSEFSKSVDEGGNNAATYRMVEAGKALDCMRESILFGNQYEMLVKSIAKSGNNANGKLMDALSDALVKSDSAEKLLNSAQSIVVLSDELDKKEAKGRENEQMVSSLDTLLNHTEKADADVLADLAGDAFETGNGTGEQKNQMMEDCVGAMATVSEEGTDDLEIEADAVQAFYDITHTDEANPFNEVSEAETVEALVHSKLAQEMLKTLNAEGRDYGVRERLTDENKKNLSDALEKSDGDVAAIAAVAAFFGIA